MRVVVIGAAGRTGRLLVQAALAAGHEVRAMSRTAAASMFPAGVEVVPGDAREATDVARAVEGCDAALVAANVQRATEWNLWSPLATPPDVVQRAVANVLAATGPGFRIVHCSAFGVGDSYARAGWVFRQMIDRTSIATPYADHAAAEALLQAGHAAWTSVRPVILTNGPATGRVQVGTELAPGSFAKISRADVAQVMVDALTHEAWHGLAVTVTS